MKNCAIVGINWGDEGKGRMVDLLTQAYDYDKEIMVHDCPFEHILVRDVDEKTIHISQ